MITIWILFFHIFCPATFLSAIFVHIIFNYYLLFTTCRGNIRIPKAKEKIECCNKKTNVAFVSFCESFSSISVDNGLKLSTLIFYSISSGLCGEWV